MIRPFVNDPDFVLYVGDVREIIQDLPADSVDCCVTSPPYYGLRDYGTGAWEGGDDPTCEHLVRRDPRTESSTLGGGKATTGHQREGFRGTCPRCGARRVDQQIGLEGTPDAYVAELVHLFVEIRRLLAPHGSVWLNIGDSYASDPRKGGSGTPNGRNNRGEDYARPGLGGLPPKNLMMIPARLALALQADGWYVRSENIWDKTNCMPESVTDRPTRSHEHVFQLTKNPHYFYDQEALREPHTSTRWGGAVITQPETTKYAKATANGHAGAAEALSRPGREWNAYPEGGRNMRSVWSIPTQSYEGAHFATMPEALARKCITAGCPTRVCLTCGLPSYTREDGLPTDCHHNTWRHGVVFDPFMGSGTTALAARNLGRHSVGVELSPDHAQQNADRLSQMNLLTATL